VLQAGAVAFSPPLTAVDRAAARLAMGNLEKVVLRFDRRCWPDNVRRLALVSDHRRFTDWVDITAHSGVTTLVAFHNPTLVDYGADRVGEALDVLRTMVGDVPDPVASCATDWTNDPFACGSYSYIPVGGSAGDMRALAGRQSPQVVFAGEHTVPEYFGTVHGAYVSGRRAAEEFR
jgi:monoamine oxidase